MNRATECSVQFDESLQRFNCSDGLTTMVCRGVHFSLDEATVLALKAITGDQERHLFLNDQIETPFFENHPGWLAQTDKAWDWIHRVLTDGELGWDNGTYPLNHVVMGGESLHAGSEFVMSLKTPQVVIDAATELTKITEGDFRDRFFQLDPFEIEHSFDEDCDYSWGWFACLREFWLRAAESRRFVLFTVDQ